jgi:hypothetical protein
MLNTSTASSGARGGEDFAAVSSIQMLARMSGSQSLARKYKWASPMDNLERQREDECEAGTGLRHSSPDKGLPTFRGPGFLLTMAAV